MTALTIVNSRFFEMFRVAWWSLTGTGGVPENVDLYVLDLGLQDHERKAIVQAGATIYEPLDRWRRLLPVPLAHLQARFDLWTLKSEFIRCVAGETPDDERLIYFDADLFAVAEVWPEIEMRYIDGDTIQIVRDPMRTEHYLAAGCEWPSVVDTMSARRRGPASPTWNIGFFVATPGAIRRVFPEYNRMILSWPELSEWWSPLCFDQLAFSVAAEHLVDELPTNFNTTRPAYTWPENAMGARVLHLTGPIKPWEPGGRIHPMTERWRLAYSQMLADAGEIAAE